MLIVSLILLLIGIVTFAVGLFGTSPAWVLVSIVTTAAAGVVLLVGRRSAPRASTVPERRRPATAAGPGHGPQPATVDVPLARPAEDRTAGEAPEPGPSAVGAVDEVATFEAETAEAETVGGETVGADTLGADTQGADTQGADTVGTAEAPPADRLFAVADQDFPIAGYDELRVAELLPVLAHLDPAALGAVQRREREGKARATVLARIDELLASGDDGFPIAAYDSLRVVDVLPLLRSLDAGQLAAVADRERRGAARQTILGRIDEMLGVRDRPRRPDDTTGVPGLFSGGETPAGSMAP